MAQMGTHSHRAAQARENLAFRTTCGREMQAGRLVPGGAERPARRVSRYIGRTPGRRDGTWAAPIPA
jgi:hypothetical protein